MKYIRHKHLGFILFNHMTGHSVMAGYFGGPEQVLSAGFVMNDPGGGAGVVCYGESTTLRGIPQATDADTKALNNQLFG